MKTNLIKLTCGLAMLGVATMAQAQIYTTLNAPLSHDWTSADGISGNNIVGGYTDSSGHESGYLYNGSTWMVLNDPLAVYGTIAFGIDGNNIVGKYNDSLNRTHGFLYNGSTWTTLNDPLGVKGTRAYGIDGNNIVGSYFDSAGYDHGFIASVPEPSMLALADLGGLSLLLFRRRKS